MFDSACTVRRLGPTDAALLLGADPEVFDHPIDERRTAAFLNDPRHHIVVALVGGRVIGGALAVHYLLPDRPPCLFIIEVAVSHPHRRRGIAKAMLHALLEHGRSIGCTHARVGTEASDLAARALYRSVAGHLQGDAMVEFTFDLE